MRIKVLSGGRKSIELPLSDAELNFQKIGRAHV